MPFFSRSPSIKIHSHHQDSFSSSSSSSSSSYQEQDHRLEASTYRIIIVGALTRGPTSIVGDFIFFHYWIRRRQHRESKSPLQNISIYNVPICECVGKPCEQPWLPLFGNSRGCTPRFANGCRTEHLIKGAVRSGRLHQGSTYFTIITLMCQATGTSTSTYTAEVITG